MQDGFTGGEKEARLKNFKLISSGHPISTFLREIESVENAWSLNQGRQSKIKVQREAQAIPIRGMVKSKIAGRKNWDVHESRFTTISKQFPIIRTYLQGLATSLNGELSRAKVVRLKPGHKVYPHIDRGEYYKMRNRYHLVFDTQKGNILKCGDEECWLQPGELWWFDNKKMHEAWNKSNAPRIHFIFDLLPH